MGDADSELGQALPQHPLIGGAVFRAASNTPCALNARAPVQQVLGIGEGFGWGQLEVIRDACNTHTARRKWPTKGVARAGASSPAGFVAITLSHMPIMARSPRSRSCYVSRRTYQFHSPDGQHRGGVKGRADGRLARWIV